IRKKISSKMTNKVCKLFIGGLSVNTNDDGLRKHFEQFGTLTDFVVLQNKNAQRSRCFGFVTYSTPEETNAAMAAAPHTVEGNSVEVKRANGSAAPAKGEKIFVGGLKNNIEEYHLTDYFSRYGPVEKSEILLEKETGKKRGFGFVHFTHHKTADLALVEKYHTVNGHLVEIKKAVAKQEMQTANRTETTPRHRPGPGITENQNGYGGFGFVTYSTPEETNAAMAASLAVLWVFSEYYDFHTVIVSNWLVTDKYPLPESPPYRGGGVSGWCTTSNWSWETGQTKSDSDKNLFISRSTYSSR
uniref:RRM domain-containing protein n=1 Tax=Oryzias latipes TaxID=8090 RepID=A0A3B3HMK7_ORYLA